VLSLLMGLLAEILVRLYLEMKSGASPHENSRSGEGL